ncbi:AAA family ATPase [Chitinophaga barathri]|uniref:ATP-binding protein n=1 Tax=Chitinophaga barathri TaxID=1647451 RepID=A0A3N4MDJ3_9BACT|nr:ATP-binding protein [Chitinophaga barathri]RPD38160.1 ATP-binding protein [Chitinophaga barathri]
MLIEFSLANFHSFNKVQTLSFKATGLVSEEKSVDEENIITEGKSKFLKIVGVYGANASGKSNLIKGLSFLKEMVASSLESDRLAMFGTNPFKLSGDGNENFGYFQIMLLIGGNRFRYGFTLDDQWNIQTEWLFGPAEKNETYYFKRDEKGVTSNPDRFKEGLSLPYDKLRDDALFLSFCAAYDGEITRMIKEYIVNNVSIDGDFLIGPPTSRFFDHSNLRRSTNALISSGRKEVILQWMKEAGLMYDDVNIRKIGSDKSSWAEMVYFTKNRYNDKGEIAGKASMSLDGEESAGTQKFYSYIGHLHSIFEKGGIFISDEIDSNFHPSLLRKLISLFQNSDVNKANAQLLFTSHDTNLMSPDYMRRDQFYFTEKTIFEETHLYSLSDLKGIRNNADFARQYLAGFYGALPQLGNYLEDTDQ